jgi:hypothetical protein
VGTAFITSLSAADGWESDIDGPEDDLQFVGYVVGLDVPEST